MHARFQVFSSTFQVTIPRENILQKGLRTRKFYIDISVNRTVLRLSEKHKKNMA